MLLTMIGATGQTAKMDQTIRESVHATIHTKKLRHTSGMPEKS